MRLFCLIVFLMGCRAEPGEPSYPDLGTWFDTADPFILGPDPFEEGDTRLSIGTFYEGGASEIVEIDDVSTHYYVYESTYTQDTVEERVEGLYADRFILADNPWWGGGVHWDSPRDLSDLDTYHLSFLSSSAAFDDLAIAVNGGGTEARVSAADYGFVTDGQWHHLDISLADFETGGADLTQVGIALVLIGESSAQGAELLVDNVYLTGGQ